ncbi:porin [Roseateles flavus]|uniref:Porin n=1 Tax=Roseateles flavus TaxID=3149041 RepID=A0ABV0GJB8_9BURK
MKKIALVAALAAVSASAFAQSSVTLWGRMNTTVESQKFGTGDRKVVVQNNSSRIGLKGAEDLGGGLKASFALEHGLNSDTGAQTSPGAFWNREAQVQLSGSFGAVRLGQWTHGSYFAVADYISMHNHDTGTSSDALLSYIGGNANKVGYFTPNIDGFVGEITMGAGEGAAPRVLDLSGNYDQGPLHLGAGFTKQGSNKQYAGRALYELGEFTVGAYLQREDMDGNTRNIWRLAGMYTMGASEFHVNLGSTSKSSDFDTLHKGTNKATQLTLGYNYNLSKRTKVYGFFTKVDSKTNGDDFNSLAAGIRHNF